MRHAAALILCLCAVLAACDRHSPEQVQPPTGKISSGKYHYAPIGWRISLPWGWNVLSQRQLHSVLDKGRGLMEKATGEDLVATETDLLYLRYNASNLFSSSVSQFDASEGPEPEQVTATFDLLLAAYEAGNFRTRSTRGSESIDGIRFDLLRISILDPNNDKREIVRQHVYLGRVGSYWLTTSITSANWVQRQQMLFAWRGSRFSTTREID